MLSDHPRAGRLRTCTNLMMQGGVLRTRPGMTARIGVPVSRVLPWGERAVVLTDAGRLAVWTGALVDVRAQETLYGAVQLATLTEDGTREDRLYVGDATGLYVMTPRASGGFRLTRVVNTVLDDASNPYPILLPVLMATWRGRLWLGDGTNRIQHSQLETPDELDPLWTLEFQAAGGVTALLPAAERLLVGQSDGLWQVEGFSQYDWARTQILYGRGPVGRDAMCTDGARVFYVAHGGVYALDGAQALSDPDLSETLRRPDTRCSLALSPDGRWLCLCHRNRVYVLDTFAETTSWAEVDPPGGTPRSVTSGFDALWLADAEGVWALGARFDDDLWADGTRTPVPWALEGWDETPNPRGKALLERAFATTLAPYGGTADAVLTVDGKTSATRVLELGVVNAEEPDLSLWDGDLTPETIHPKVHELALMRAGQAFRLRLSGRGAVELRGYEFGFRTQESRR